MVGEALTGEQSTSLHTGVAAVVQRVITYLLQPPVGAEVGGVTMASAVVCVMLGPSTLMVGALQRGTVGGGMAQV